MCLREQPCGDEVPERLLVRLVFGFEAGVLQGKACLQFPVGKAASSGGLCGLKFPADGLPCECFSFGREAGEEFEAQFRGEFARLQPRYAAENEQLIVRDPDAERFQRLPDGEAERPDRLGVEGDGA